MLQNYNRYRILQEFFDYPKKDFLIRQLSRKVKLAQVSVINHLAALIKDGLVIKENKGIYPSFRANTENEDFRLLKQQNLIWRIRKSDLISYLDDTIKPTCVVLFGSASRGEDTENSDIDLFPQSGESDINVEKYENALNRKISILFESDIRKLGKELLNNILNGHVLYGYLKAVHDK